MGHKLLLSPIPTRACYITVQQLFSFCYYNNKRIRLSWSLTHNRSHDRRTRNRGQCSEHSRSAQSWAGTGGEMAFRSSPVTGPQTPELESSGLPSGTLSFWTQLVTVTNNSALPCYIIHAYPNTTQTKVYVSCQLLWKSPILRLLWFIPSTWCIILRGKRWMFLNP